jgi:hypothetical protein
MIKTEELYFPLEFYKDVKFGLLHQVEEYTYI